MASTYRGGGSGRPLRPLFDKLCRDHKATLGRDGELFLRATLAYEDKLDLLFRLASPKERGMQHLRTALSQTSPTSLNTYVVPLLAMLGSDALSGTACRKPLLQVLEQIYKVPGLMSTMHEALASGSCQEAAPLGWFLLTLASKVEEVRQDPEVQAMATLLEDMGPGPAAKAGRELRVVLAGSEAAASAAGGDAVVTVEDLHSGPGGRHDNDHVDYRSISIIPTPEEALCPRQPFLPVVGDRQHLSSPEAMLLDRQFRLMREDMVQPLRQTMAALSLTHAQAAGGDGAGAVAPPLPQQLQRNMYPLVAVLGVALKPRPCTMVAVQLPPSHRAHPHRMRDWDERLAYWSDYGFGTLAQDALVCLVVRRQADSRGGPRRGGGAPGGEAAGGRPFVVFGTIARRDPRELAEEMPVIGLSFDRGQEAEQLLRLMGSGGLVGNAMLVQVSTSFFSFEPLLKALQSMPTVPLAEEIVQGQASGDAGYLSAEHIEQEIASHANLDPTQKEALSHALSRRVSLIQGPPGTGKTYVGALVANAIVKRTKETILVVCYTNHALDQFLESLLEKGITDIVRIGSKSKSTALEQYNLFMLKRGRLANNEFRRKMSLESEERESKEQVSRLEQLLVFFTSGCRQSSAQASWNQLTDQERRRLQQQEANSSGSDGGGRGGGRDGGGGWGGGRGRGRQGSAAAAAPPPPPPPPPPGPHGQKQQQQQQQQQQRLEPAYPPEVAVRDAEGHIVNFDLWKVLGPHLEENCEEAWEQLQPPSALIHGKGGGNTRWAAASCWRTWLCGYPNMSREEQAGGKQGGEWQQAGKQGGKAGKGGKAGGEAVGRVVSYPYAQKVLLERTSRALATLDGGPGGGTGGGSTSGASGLGRDVEMEEGEAPDDIWALGAEQRMALAVSWMHSLNARWCEELASAMARCKALQDEIRTLSDSQLVPLLKGARVIGCTATGAAKYKELLQNPDIAPTVVMVEEAGELHESHTLTSLSERTKQLILIGDHKQLRPKVECYSLSVESGHGHDLNVSLFERLAVGGFPHVTLGVQHRMHPEISAIVRSCTYPQLQDHASVQQHPPLLGVQGGRRLLFLDHNVPEEQEKAGWGNYSFKSKVNQHEVEMTVAVANFFLQQGYSTEQVVVLTPYLGQLMELHKAFKKRDSSLQVTLSELDMAELRNAAMPQLADYGITASSSAPAGKGSKSASASRSIRLSTIDNFQGEEADVILASLVRSNDQGSIGFLREPERINVLMSRARHGMVLVGSAATLRNCRSSAGRQHWGKVLGLIEAAGGMLPGLPSECQLHATRALLRSPKAFAEQAPQGGCCLPCNAKMPCGHVCQLRCHVLDREHLRVRCTELIHEVCAEGHVNAIRCHERSGSCKTCVELQRIRDEERRKLAALQEEATRARAEAEAKREQLQARIEALRLEQEKSQQALAARKEQIRLELEGKRLEAELKLQSQHAATDLAEWEKEQRSKAEADIKDMQQEARLEAAMKKDKKDQQLLKEAQKRERELAAAAWKLQGLEKDRDAKLQEIENRKTRAETKADEGVLQVTAKANASAASYMTLSMWAEAVSEAAAGVEGVSKFKAQLQAACGTCDTLDLVLYCEGVGEQLLQYARMERTVEPRATGSSSLGRGLTLIAEGKLLDALAYFTAAAEAGASTSGTSAASTTSGGGGSGGGQPSAPAATAAAAARSLLALCRAKLDLSQPPGAGTGAGAAASSASAAKKVKLGRRLVEVPMVGDGAAAGSDEQQQQRQGGQGKQGEQEQGQVLTHPAQHLADAVAAARQAAAAAGPELTAASEARRLHGRAAAAALLFLLHPASQQLPASLGDEARAVLAASAKALASGAAAAAVTGASGGSGGSGGGGGGPGAGQRAAWQERAAKTASFGKALALIGLAPVKQALSNLADQVDLDKERGIKPGDKQYNAIFYGNPGTGKTTVARIYAEVLKDLGVLPDSKFVETSGAKLAQGGVNELKDILKALDSGGVLFVDESYQLNPQSNPMGAQVLDALLPEMENRRGKMVVVFAGYKKQMEGLLAYNEGLPSRFPLEFTFPDYSDSELHAIFKGIMAKDPRFKLQDEKYGRIAAARLGRQRGTVGFGNARAVRNLYERVLERQAARVLAERQSGGNPDLFLVTRHDLLGPKFLDVSSCQALADLQGMRGLKSVKEQVNNLLGLIRTNAELEEQGKPLKEVCLNRVLVGNPGTGKTTVASLYGRILKDLGLLSKGDVVVKVPADFTGAVLGESEQKTTAILDAAKGSVLVIDEAYGLYAGTGTKDPFKEAIIDTIVAKVQGVPGDDRCVLLLGYEDQMEAMMRGANPGLMRRFQWQSRWHFQDYAAEDLLHIMRNAAKRRYDWELQEEVLLAGIKVLEAERRKPNFGNAGAVNNLLSLAAERMESRLKDLPPDRRAQAQPVVEDFCPRKRKADPESIFEDLVGCKDVLGQLRKWQAIIKQCQKMGRDPLQSVELNFRFVGAPGTGKTTVARRVGVLFESLGLLATSDIVSCSASDFTTGFANQSGGKTREVFEKAVGGVLFIDEAYRLNPKIGGPMMAEACDEIVQILTEERFMNKMVVILAGYDQQIDDLMKVNPGLKSRFSQKLFFPDFSCGDACTLFKQQMRREYDLELSQEAAGKLPALMQQLIDAPGWSNGRDVVTLSKRAFAAYCQRQAEPPSQQQASDGGGGGAAPMDVDSAEASGSALSAADLTAAVQDLLSTKGPPQPPKLPQPTQPTQPTPPKGGGPSPGAPPGQEGAEGGSDPGGASATAATTSTPHGDGAGAGEGGEGGEPDPFEAWGQLAVASAFAHAIAAPVVRMAAPAVADVAVAEPVVADVAVAEPVVADVDMEERVEVDIAKGVMAALEEACAELKYSLDQVAAILRPGGTYPDELLQLVMAKAGTWDRSKVITALDMQKPAFLSKVEQLIEMRQRQKDEMEMKMQQKIAQMGVCPMNFQWLKVQGGWQCAGGGHFLSEGQVKP